MHTPKSSSLTKKVLLGALALLQAVYPLAASANQYIQLVPVPNLVVVNGGALSNVNVDSANTSTTTTLAGNAVLKSTPATVNFGSVVTGTEAVAQTITLSNLGGAAAVLGALSTNAQFVVTDNCDGVTLPSLGTCQVNVTFAPTQVALGGLWGTLSVPFTSGTAAATALIGMQGVATWPTGALADTLKSAALTGFSGSDPALFINASGQAQIAFGSALFNQQASSKSFTLSSTGNAPVTFFGLTLSGAASADGSYSVSSNCPAQVPNGTSCTVTVAFAPTSPGTKSATLSVNTSSMAGNAMDVVLAGTATSDATFSLSASQLTFGGLPVGQTTTQSIAVLNTGNVALVNPTLTASGSFFSSTHNCPVTLAVGDSCTASVSFDPASPAHVTGALSVGFDGAATVTAVLSGQGLGPVLTVDALSQNFGQVVVGESASRGYTLSNEGNVAAPLSFSALPANMTLAGDCPSAIAASAVCHLVLTYSPTSVTPLSGALTVTSTLNALSLGFTGTATYNPSFALSSTVLSFDSMQVNSSGTQQLTVLNNGNVTLGVPTVQVSGTGFSASHNCVANMAPGTSCNVSVTFAPGAHLAYAGGMSVQFSNATAQTVVLSGNGQGAVLSFDSTSQSFGNVPLGENVALTYILTNSGNLTADLSYDSLPAPVTRSGTCSTAIGAGAHCTIVLTFHPVDATQLTGAFTVTSPTSLATLDFAGTGTLNPAFTSSAASLAFGAVAIGTSAPLSVMLTNSGNVTLTNPAAATGAGFTSTNDCTATLAVGSSCTVSVRFAPTAAQSYADTLSVTFDGGTTHTVALSGTGLSLPGVALSATSVAFGTVTTGGTSQFTVSVNNSGNVPVSTPVISSSGSGFTSTYDCGATLAVGASCFVTLTFIPTAPQAYSGSLLVSFDGVPVQSTALSGTGQQALLVLGSTAQAFGSVSIGTNGMLSYTLTNSGNLAAQLSYGTLPTAVTRGGTCSTALGAGATCSIVLNYAPTDTTTTAGTLSINSPTSATALSFSGTGVALPGFSLSATAVAFGNVATGATSQLTVSVNNSGNVPLSTPVIGSTGPGYSATDNCAATLAVGAHCIVTVTFAPTAPQAYPGNLSIGYSGVTSQAAALSGTGQAAVLSLDATTKAFGLVAIGATGTLSYTLSNSGNITAQLSYGVLPIGVTRAGTCSTAIGDGANCTIVLSYAPADTTATAGSLAITSPTSSTALNFSGTGVANPSFSVSSTALAFGNVVMGTTAQLTVSVNNTGNVALSTPAIGISGMGYTGSHNCAATLAVGTSCLVTATFAPLAPQSNSGLLSIGFGGLTAQPVSLTGLGLADYAANLAAYVNAQVASCVHPAWATGLGTWYSLNANGCVNVPAITVGVGKPVTVLGTVPVLAKLRVTADDISANLRVNGAAVSISNGGFSVISESSVFTLYPGVNSVTMDVTNGGGPGGWVLQVVDSTGATVLSDTTGWKYTGTPQSVLTVSPATQTFGIVNIGSSGSLTYTVSNIGDLAATLGYTALPAGVTKSGTSTCLASLAAGTSCTVVLAYAPTSVTATSGSLTLSATSAAVTLNFSGQGNAGILASAGTRTWADGTVAASCKAYLQGGAGYVYAGNTGDGVYRIDVDGAGPLTATDVACDMTTDGGGWTVLQQRVNGAVDFYRTYAEYAAGFGAAATEYWVGNDRIAAMTASGTHSLRFDLSRTTGETAYETYSSFKLNGASDGYRLTVSGAAGNAGDSFTAHSGYAFTTKDVDQDISSDNCAITFRGAWWYSNCHSSNLNGAYLNGPHASYADGVEWYAWTGYNESLKTTQMKVRAN